MSLGHVRVGGQRSGGGGGRKRLAWGNRREGRQLLLLLLLLLGGERLLGEGGRLLVLWGEVGDTHTSGLREAELLRRPRHHLLLDQVLVVLRGLSQDPGHLLGWRWRGLVH